MITQKRVSELFWYNYETGNLHRKTNIGGKEIDGIAGIINEKGYVIIGIDNNRYRAHKLVWLYHYGYMPNKQIDHINGIKNDNRIENMRQVDNRDNHLNMKSHRNGRLYGTIKDRGKYISRIRVDDKRIFLGTFYTEQEAHNAYKKAYKKYINKNVPW